MEYKLCTQFSIVYTSYKIIFELIYFRFYCSNNLFYQLMIYKQLTKPICLVVMTVWLKMDLTDLTNKLQLLSEWDKLVLELGPN